MKITQNNAFDNTGTLTIPTDDDVAQDSDNLELFGGDALYSSAGTAATFSILKTFAGADRFPGSYVALSGHNFGDDARSLGILVNTVSKGTVSFSAGRSNDVMVTFAEVALVDRIELIFTKSASGFVAIASYVAAGQAIDIPNSGEQGGYTRDWLQRHEDFKTTRNDQAAPVAVIKRAMANTLSLNIPNMGRAFAEGTWQSILDNIYTDGAFFIRERDDEPRSAYLCTSPSDRMRAHGATRELVVASLSFTAYTGV